MTHELAQTLIPWAIGGFGLVCLVAGYWFGEIMGHANCGYHCESPFSSFTWRTFTHHFWPNLVYRLRDDKRRFDKIG